MMKIKTDTDREAVLLTLDHLSQTMEAMHQVVSRLKRSVELSEAKPPRDAKDSMDLQQSSSGKSLRADQPTLSPVVSQKKSFTLH